MIQRAGEIGRKHTVDLNPPGQRMGRADVERARRFRKHLVVHQVLVPVIDKNAFDLRLRLFLRFTVRHAVFRIRFGPIGIE